MLELKGITKTYRTDLVETYALNDVSLSVGEGEFVAVTGPSGSGKTTFLNITGLLDSFDRGSYHLDGEDVTGLSDRKLSKVRNHKLGFIFQSFNLIPDLDVYDNVDLPLRYKGLKADRRARAIDASLELVGLGGRRKHLPSQLSGGQQQRVAIARALATEPRLILADEPTGNLDSAMAHEVMRLLEEVNGRGTTIIMVTHNPECAARAHRQIHILDGRLIDLKEDQSLSLAASGAPAAGAPAAPVV